MIAGLVLAAGESKRMGVPKALLTYGPQTFVEIILEKLQQLGIPERIVVLGPHREVVTAQVTFPEDVTVVENRRYQDGQFSSLQCGLREVSVQADGVLVVMVDQPHFPVSVAARMIDALAKTGKAIVVPRCGERRGHPVVYSAALFSEILQLPSTETARTLLHRHRERIGEIQTDDQRVLIDIDTPEDYARLGELFGASS